MKLLTPLELKVMNILWGLQKGFIKDILNNWDEEPKPAYQTISTIVRILEKKKGYIGFKAYGKTHEYFPLISKNDYQKSFLNNAVQNVFAGSMASLVSALVDQTQVSSSELDALKALIDESKKA